MSRYALLAGAVAFALLATFFLFQLSGGGELLGDPRAALQRLGVVAPLASVALLVGDVVLPIPSSLLMMANGALFGVAGGTLVSTAGGVGATQAAFWIGRRSTRLVTRLTSEAERRAVHGLLARWGALAIVVTRPVPILAETAAILAGTTPMGWGRLTAAALAGSVPPAVAYAVAGAHAREASVSPVFLGVLAAAGAFWILGHVLGRRA